MTTTTAMVRTIELDFAYDEDTPEEALARVSETYPEVQFRPEQGVGPSGWPTVIMEGPLPRVLEALEGLGYADGGPEPDSPATVWLDLACPKQHCGGTLSIQADGRWGECDVCALEVDLVAYLESLTARGLPHVPGTPYDQGAVEAELGLSDTHHGQVVAVTASSTFSSTTLPLTIAAAEELRDQLIDVLSGLGL